MANPRYPSLCEASARLPLEEWPDRDLDRLKDGGFDGICLVGSGRAGRDALARFRERLSGRGLRLLLDFVPNHRPVDHPWVAARPELFVGGTAEQLAREPGSFFRVETAAGEARVLAHGRDPYFPAWTGTAQLDFGKPAVHDAMIEELAATAELCDGVRCAMAMLVLPEIFKRTWGVEARPFWPRAIESVRARRPDFLFVAEAYWDLEWPLQHVGFDFVFDKKLYDRLREGNAGPVRGHLSAGIDFQSKLARFVENHVEPRATEAFLRPIHEAAAVATFFAPGLRLFHDGQAGEDPGLRAFYGRLLAALRVPAVREGSWQLLDARPAWAGNWTAECFLAYAWRGLEGRLFVVAVNYAPNHSQCYLPLPFPELADGTFRLTDLLGPASYDREGESLRAPGLFLDVGPWAYHVFEVVRV